MKKITSFTKMITGEGVRMTVTFSEIDGSGSLISQNNKVNFIVMDEGLEKNIKAIDDYIYSNILGVQERAGGCHRSDR